MKLIVTVLGWVFLSVFSLMAKEVTVGIVADDFDAAYERDRAELVSEIKQLVSVPDQIHFPESKRINGEGSLEQITKGLARLQGDPEVNVIVVFGTIAGHIAFSERTHRKPTLITVLRNGWLSGLPQKKRGSGINNVNYVISSIGFGEAVTRYLELTAFTHAALFVDAQTLSLPSVKRNSVIEVAGAQGVELDIVPVEQNGTVMPDNDIQAVLLADLSGVDKAGREQLVGRLKRQNIPVFALGSIPAIGTGIFASLTIPDENSRNIRLSALNLLSILRGVSAESLPVSNEAPSTLTVDMAVARQLHISPPFSALEEAHLIHETYAAGTPVGLGDVAAEALRNNLAVIAGKLRIQEGNTAVFEVRSVLFPQIGAAFSYTQLNSGNVYVESGFYAEKSTDGALRLEQLLFSEKALARLDIQKQLQTGREAQQRGLELEVVRNATTAFLHTLIARTLLDIRRENERLMQANLTMARERVAAGMSDLSDEYYWESEIAVARQARLAAEADVAKAYETLNRILHRPVTARYALRDADLDDPALLISDRTLLERIANERAFEQLNRFYIEEAESVSPDLDAIDARLRAERRQRRSDERAYWSPDVALRGEVTRIFDEHRVPGAAFSLEDQTNWTAGVTVTLPLFEGGAKNARTTRSRLGVQRLEADRMDRMSFLEQSIRGDLHTLRAAYPAIALAKAAATAARNSYTLVRENYAQGNRSLSDLLLAQNRALSADFGIRNTRYRFLIDLMQLQYDSGRFEFLMTPDERADFIVRLHRALFQRDEQQESD